MENTQKPEQAQPNTDPKRKAVGDLIKHYEPEAEITDEYLDQVVSSYESDDELFKSLIGHYEPEAEIDSTYLSGIYSSYGIGQDGVKKKPIQDGSEVSADGVPEQSKSNYSPLALSPEEQTGFPGQVQFDPSKAQDPQEKVIPAPGNGFVDSIIKDGRKPYNNVDRETREPFLNYYKENYEPLKGQLGIDDKTMQLYIGLAEGLRSQEIKQDNIVDKTLSNFIDGETMDTIGEAVTKRSYGFINMHEEAIPHQMTGIDPKLLNQPEIAAQAMIFKIHNLFQDPNIQQIPETDRRIDAVTASYNQGATGETEPGKSYPERYVANRVKDGGNLDLKPFQTDSYSLDVYGHLQENVRKELGINPVREEDLYDTSTTNTRSGYGGYTSNSVKILKPEIRAEIEAQKQERIAAKQEQVYDKFMAGNEYVDGQASSVNLYKEYLKETDQGDRLEVMQSKKEAGKSIEKDELRLFNEAVIFKAGVIKRKSERLGEDPAVKEMLTNLSSTHEEMKEVQQQAQIITTFLEAEKSKGQENIDISTYNQKVVELQELQEKYKGLVSEEDQVRNSDQFRQMQALEFDWKETETALKDRLNTYPNAYREYILQKSKSVAATKEYSESTGSKMYQQVVSPIGWALANSAEGLLSLPRTLTANNEYGWTDWLAEQGEEMANSARENQFAQSEIFSQGLFSESGEMNNELLPNKIIRTGADMVMLLAGGNKIAAPLKALGVGAKASTGAGLFASSFVNTHNSYYNSAIAEGLTPTQASAFATSSGLVTSSLEFINPQKYLMGGGDAVKRQVVKDFAKNIAKGQSSKVALGSASKFLTKEIVGENVQELSQMMADKSIEYMSNQMLDEEKFKAFKGDIVNEFKETVVLTTIVAGAPALLNSKQPMNEMQRNAMLTAAMDESFRPKISEAFDAAGINEETRNKVLQKIETMADANAKIPETYQGKDRVKILDLMVEMGEIEAKIKGKHALFTVSEKEQIKAIKEKVNTLITAAKVIEGVKKTEETNEQRSEAAAKPAKLPGEPIQDGGVNRGEEPGIIENGSQESGDKGAGITSNPEVNRSQNQPVREIRTEQKSEQATPEVKEIRIEVGSKKTAYTARKTENGLEIVNEKTGKAIDRKSKAYDEVVSAYTKENLETFAGQPFIEIDQEINPEEYSRKVSEESQSPLEVALAWDSMQETELDNKTKIISENIKQFPKESFYRFGDRNNVAGGAEQIRTNYFSKEGTPLDTQAQNLSEEFGIEITPEDLAQFVSGFPGGATTAKVQNPVAKKLEERFETLTGLPITKDLVNDLSNVESKAAMLEQLEEDLLDAINNEGVTLENIDSMKETLFGGFPFTEEEFNLVKNHLQNEGQQKAESAVGSVKNPATDQQGQGSATESGTGKEGVKKPKEAKAEFSRGQKPRPAKASTQYVNEVVDRLRKIFPNLPVQTDETAFSQALDHAQANEPDRYKDGDITFGFFFMGTFYINTASVREDTPIHEFAHPFLLLMKEKYPALYRKGIELVERSQYYKDITNSEAYKIPEGLSEKERNRRVELQKEEALVTAIGEKGADIFKKKYSKETASWRNRMRQYVADFWTGLRHKIGFPKSLDLQKMSLDEFASISAYELLRGEVISDKTSTEFDYRNSYGIPLGSVHHGLLRGNHIFATHKSDPELYRSKSQKFRRFLLRGLHDRYFRITELVEKAATNLSDQNNIAQKMELMKGKAVAIMSKMEEKVIKSKPQSKSKALFERLTDAGLNIDTMGKYMYALHAPERNKHVAKIRQEAYNKALEELGDEINMARVKGEVAKEKGDKARETYWTRKQKELIEEVKKIQDGDHDHIYLLPDGGSGMTNKQAGDLIDKLKTEGTHDQYEKFAEEFQESVIRPNLENLVKSGVLTQEEFDFLKYDSVDGYRHYVPLIVKQEELNRRKSGGGVASGLDMASKGIHSSVGSARYTHEYRENPVDAALTSFRATAINLEKNLAGQSLLRFALENPDPTIFEVRKPSYAPRYDQDGDISSVEMSTQKADNEIQVFVDGQVHFIKIQDQDLLRALKDMDSKGVNAALEGLKDFLAGVHNWLRLVYTGINPEFLITNFTRDLQAALINISKEEINGASRDIMKNIFPAMKGVYGVERGKDSGTKWNETYRELMDHGGKTSWFGNNDIKSSIEDAREAIKAYENKGGWMKTKNGVKKVTTLLQDLNTSVEMAVRLAAYKALTDKGVSKEKAASVAKNLTVNFEKKGLFAIFLDTAYLFANASIQGSAIIIKNLATSKQVRQRALAVAAFAVLVNIWNDMFDEDDEYWMNESEKERNLVIMIPKSLRAGKLNRVTIPLPYGFNVFKVFGDIAYEAGVSGIRKGASVTGASGVENFFSDMGPGNTSPARILSKVLGSVHGAFSPISGDIGTAWVPTLFKPFYEIELNRNFMGSPIKREQQQFRKVSKDSERYFKSVSPIAKSISDQLDKLGGGSGTKEGEIFGMSTSISPEVLEHLWGTYTGGLGKFILNTATTVTQAAQGEMPNLQNIPIVRQFLKEESEWAASQIIWEMWENSEKTLYTDREVELFENAVKNAKESEIMDRSSLREKLRDFKKSQRKLKKE